MNNENNRQWNFLAGLFIAIWVGMIALVMVGCVLFLRGTTGDIQSEIPKVNIGTPRTTICEWPAVIPEADYQTTADQWTIRNWNYQGGIWFDRTTGEIMGTSDYEDSEITTIPHCN